MTHTLKNGYGHDYKDVEGRATPGAVAEGILVENCSFIFDTSAIRGGSIPVLQVDYTDDVVGLIPWMESVRPLGCGR